MKNLIFVLIVSFIGCNNLKNSEKELNSIAEKYVKLTLEIGNYDNLYIDAYYGPKEWKTEAKKLKQKEFPYNKLLDRAKKLYNSVEIIQLKKSDKLLSLRKKYLLKQLISVKARIKIINGEQFTFNQESDKLYDAIVPDFEDAYFSKIISELEKLLPGNQNLIDRLSNFQQQFVIPKNKIDTVFKAAIKESRSRTKKYIPLPNNENFKLEYVTDKAWAGYNWYKGNNFSLIQINIDFPILIDRAIDLASHEGYPGHHVYNCLLETNMVKKHGWIEFSVYPLFSPQSLIAEGTANYGINVVFPKADRIKFEKNVLFKLAGLDSNQVELYYKIKELTHKLSYARTVAMRNYLDGKWTKEKTGKWLEKYALRRAHKSTFRFPETYRSYIINYNWGQDLVKKYIEKNGGKESNPQKTWEIFTYLISTPQVPSNLE